jgi:hypothetical protein
MDRECFPAELSDPETVSALAVLIAESAADATQIREIDWEPQHQLWWESRLRRLSQAIGSWHPDS